MKTIALAAVLMAAPAAAQDAPLNVEQCLTILSGLKSLDWVGQQLGQDQTHQPADAKRYKLGDALFTISMDIGALSPILSSYLRSLQSFQAEQAAETPLPLAAEQSKALIAHQLNDLAKPCPVNPGHVKLSDLKLGDGPDQNAIPPTVLATFSIIVDKDK